MLPIVVSMVTTVAFAAPGNEKESTQAVSNNAPADRYRGLLMRLNLFISVINSVDYVVFNNTWILKKRRSTGIRGQYRCSLSRGRLQFVHGRE